MFSSLSSLSFLSPLALALGALAIPIILLYMLRLRRTEMMISSTFLWRQLVRDREANAPWQRLRPSWLLLLQLLILAVLVLALARPFSKVTTITTGRIVLLLDASASMKATDVDPNRFEAAREIGLDMVDKLGADDTMTVIQVSEVPEVLAAASRDKLVLRDAIQSARAGDVSADWVAAMTLAAAGAVGVDELKVVIVSDGGLPENLPPVPGDVRFVPVGRRQSNLAISALATGALPGEQPQLFARISNYADVETDVIVDIRLNESDTIFYAYRYTVPAQGSVNLFEIELPEDFDTLVAHISPPSNAAVSDYLKIDDVAYAVRDRSGAGRVLLSTTDNIFLRQIFRSLPGVQLYEVTPDEPLPAQDFDLYVFDGWLPTSLPDDDLLLVNSPHGASFFDLGAEVSDVPGPILADKNDSRTRNLAAYLQTVNLGTFRTVSNTPWAINLVTVGDYPLVVAGEVDNRQVVILPFDASYPNTDLVLQPAWPILMAELASWFSPPRITDAGSSLQPGTPVTVRFIENADNAEIILPDGERASLTPESGQMIFADTLQPGLYQVNLRKGEDIIKTEHFVVNLFDPAESRIEPRTNVVVGSTTIAQDLREETGRREYWPWLAGIGLLVLVIEWVIYHRSLLRMPRAKLSGFGGGRTLPKPKRLSMQFGRRRRQPSRLGRIR